MIRFTSINNARGTKLISRRMFILTAAKSLVFVGIVGRLVSLQINENTKYMSLSDKNRFREWKLAPQRGIIKDYFDNEIASNKKVYQLHITPENVKNINTLFFKLKNILDLPDKKINFFKKKIKQDVLYEVSKNLKNAVDSIFNDIKNNKNKKSTILLSPASASFDQFKNFESRGNYFKNLLFKRFKGRLYA